MRGTPGVHRWKETAQRIEVRALSLPWPEAARPGPDEHTVNRNKTSTPNLAACACPWTVLPHPEYARLKYAREARLKLMLA